MKLYLLFFLVMILSCSGPEENLSGNSLHIVKVDLNNIEIGNISDRFDKVSYLLLETTEEQPLVFPYNFQFTANSIFVRDMTMNNLFEFTLDGQVKYVMQPTGKGPGEYFQMDGYQVTADHIYIQDTYLKKNLTFTREGAFVKETKNELNNTAFYVGENFTYYFLNYNPEFEGFNLIRQNHETLKFDGFLDIPKEVENLTKYDARNTFVDDSRDNNGFFIMPLSTELIKFDKRNGNIGQSIKFDFGEFAIQEEERHLSRSRKNTIIEAKNLVEHIDLFFRTDTEHFIHFRQGGNKSHFLFFDDDFNITYHATSLVNDLDGFELIVPWTYANGHLIFRMNSIDFYNKYIKKFSGQKIQLEAGSVHEFFQTNKEKFLEEKWVLIKVKVK